jgi:hypothetical protein
VLSAALAFGAWWTWLMTGDYWRWSTAEAGMLAVWAGYGAVLHFGDFRWWPAASVLGLILVSFAAGALAV